MKHLRKRVGRFIFIVAVVLCTIALCILFLGNNSWRYFPFQIWADYLSNTTQIPQSGSYYCNELQLSITFGEETNLVFPDGEVVAIAIDRGSNLQTLNPEDTFVRGSYTSRLSNGYVVIAFESLPIKFAEGRSYRFYLLDETGRPTS